MHTKWKALSSWSRYDKPFDLLNTKLQGIVKIHVLRLLRGKLNWPFMLAIKLFIISR